MKYDAFISYSHSADGQLAPALQTGLQRLAKPWYRRRALTVFRDETGLGVDPHMWNSITAAMNESRYFVLLASPAAAASPAVNREIEHWLEHHPADTMLPVLTDGTLVWSDTQRDFDATQSSALPAALAGVYRDEPRHLDMRWARDETQLDLRHSRFRAQLAALAAPIHGMAREDLESEDVRLHRRAMRLAGTAVVGLALLTLAALVATGLAVSYAATARDNEARATRSALEARRQRARALDNAHQAKLQKSKALLNAARASQNQQEAETQQALAQANAAEAQNNAAQAAANGAQSQLNAKRAAASAQQAERNAATAAIAADEAQKNAARADSNAEKAKANAEQARQEQGRAESNALVALSRQLAANSLNNIDTHYDVALLQAAAANRVLPTAQARDSLFRTVLAHPEVRLQFQSDLGRFDKVLVSPNGDTIMTSNSEGATEIWDANTGRRRARVGLRATAAAYGPGDQLAVAGLEVRNVEIIIVDTTSGDLRHRISYIARGVPADGFGPLAFAADGKTLAIATADFFDSEFGIDLWDLTGEPKLTATIATGAVGHLAFSPDGNTLAWSETDLAASSPRENIFVRHLLDGRVVGPIGSPGGAALQSLSFSRDSLVLQANKYAGDDAVVFWDANTGTQLREHAVLTGNIVAASPDQRLIAIASGTDLITFENVNTGRTVGTAVINLNLHAGAYAFMPDSRELVAVLPSGGVSVVEVAARPDGLGHRLPITVGNDDTATLSDDGGLIAIAHNSTGPVADPSRIQGISVLDTTTGAVVVQQPSVRPDPYRVGRFSPDGDVFAFSANGRVNLLDIRDGTIRRLRGNSASVEDFAFSPDGHVLAAVTLSSSSTWGTLRLWDITSAIPRVLPRPTLHGYTTAVAYSPDGTLAVATTDRCPLLPYMCPERDGQIELFASHQPVRVLNHYLAYDLAFSPDGRTLAANQERGMTLLSMPDGIPIGAPLVNQTRGGDAPPMTVAFDQGEGLIATGFQDGTIQLWDIASATRVGPPLTGHVDSVDSLVFTRPGRLVSVSSFAFGGEVISWQLESGWLLRRACARANRDLSRGEWEQLIGNALEYDPPCAAISASAQRD